MAIAEHVTIGARRPPAPESTLNPRRYTSAEFHQLEMDRLWSRTWQLACLDTDIPSVGDWYEYEIGDMSILVVRESDERIRAYQNVCLHRGRKLKSGCGHGMDLRCPYHGWAWRLDGSLLDVPDRDTYCPFDEADAGLLEVRVEQWNHWVFVNPDPAAAPLAESFGELAEILAPYRYDRQYKWWSRTTVVRANWKTLVDAFNEAHHARTIHPESVGFINVTDYPIRIVGDHSMMVIPLGEPDALAMPVAPDYDELCDAMEWSFKAFGEDTALVDVLRQMPPQAGRPLRDILLPLLRAGFTQSNIDVSGLTDSQIVDDWHFQVFPNVLLNSFSFGYWLFRFRPCGSDPNACYADMWYFHRVPDGMDLPEPDRNQLIPEGESCGAVMDQDFENVVHHQAGLRNPRCRKLVLSSLEARIDHMHQVVDRYLEEA